MAKVNIKKGDKVKVIAGNSRGKISTVSAVFPTEGKVLIEGVNSVTKHNKPTSGNPNGAITKIELPINISNVMLLDEKGNVTRVGRRVNKSGKTERFSVNTGNVI
jgi:large subunit ribosomal protein L24